MKTLTNEQARQSDKCMLDSLASSFDVCANTGALPLSVPPADVAEMLRRCAALLEAMPRVADNGALFVDKMEAAEPPTALEEQLGEAMATEIVRQGEEIDNAGDGETILFMGHHPAVNLIDLAKVALNATATFQQRVAPWLDQCFGPEIPTDVPERNHRFIEEALELVQANGCTRHEVRQLVDYVYGRDPGEVNQEVGGVMVTLAALCLTAGIDMHEAAETELARVWENIDKIRAKQAAKPRHSPLPA